MMVLMDDNVDNELHPMDEMDPKTNFIQIIQQQQQQQQTCGFGFNGGKNFDTVDIV